MVISQYLSVGAGSPAGRRHRICRFPLSGTTCGSDTAGSNDLLVSSSRSYTSMHVQLIAPDNVLLMRYIHCKSKKQNTILRQMLTYFQNYFTVRLGSKFIIPHHTLNMSLHYPVKYLCSKKSPCSRSKLIEANRYVILTHSKTVLKYLSGKISIIW